ncbi:MAG: response regulator transcription factor [Elusimicrobiota bacterium]
MGDKKKILIAEDDPEYLDLLKYALTTAGYAVTACEDGGKALEAALADRPDLVLTDVRMPELDGYHFAQELGDKYGADCPKIIVMTSRDIEREKGVALLSGAANIIQKPFKISLLKEQIEKLLGE